MNMLNSSGLGCC